VDEKPGNFIELGSELKIVGYASKGDFKGNDLAV
jgi:hypothetical protein